MDILTSDWSRHLDSHLQLCSDIRSVKSLLGELLDQDQGESVSQVTQRLLIGSLLMIILASDWFTGSGQDVRGNIYLLQYWKHSRSCQTSQAKVILLFIISKIIRISFQLPHRRSSEGGTGEICPGISVS